MTDPVRLLDPDSIQHPYANYARLRRKSPIYRMPETGWFVVSSYELIRQVARDHRTFTDDKSAWVTDATWKNPAVHGLFEREGWPDDMILSKDPPAHQPYRSLVDTSFTRARIEAMEPSILTEIDDLVAGFAADRACEFIQAFAYPLPMRVIADRLGLPRDDLPRLKYWSEEWVKQFSQQLTLDEELRVARDIIDLQQYLAGQFEEKRRRPDGRMISDLVNGKLDGERHLTTRELMSIAQQLLVGGNETTTNALSSGMKLLIENPDQQRQLRDDPNLIKTFVEEVLRLESPTQGIFRVATCDTELGGVAIPRGSLVNMRFGAANRDEAVFTEPDLLDVCRRNAGAHLAFSTGEHHCVGAPLSRQEMRLSFQILLARFENFRFTPGRNDFGYLPHFMLRSLKELHISFDARS
jgi:cytochrome P450